MKNITSEFGRFLRHHRRKQLAPRLGERELEVMKILWRGESLSAQQVLQRIADNSLSLSTMQSTLERLHRKQLLIRKKSGRRFVYDAAVSQSVIISQLLEHIAEQITDGEMAPMVSGFMSFIDVRPPEAISEEARKVIEGLAADSDD